MEIWIFTLFFLWLWKFLLGKVKLTPVFYKSKVIIVILIIWLVYIAFQCIPLPISLIQWLSPEAAYLHSLSSIKSTATLSVAPHITAISLLKSISYLLIFLLTILLVRREKRLRWLAYTLVFSGLYQAFYGSLMLLSGLDSLIFEKKYYMDVATGTFVNRNHLAGYLEMTLAIGIGLLISQLTDSTDFTWKQRLRSIFKWLLSGKMLLRLYLVIMVIALVLTHSRMGNTGFFASMMITGLITLIFFRKHATRSTVILLISLLIIDIFIVGAWFGIEKVAERIQGTTMDTITRDEVDEYTLHYWQDYLLTGSGLGTYYLTFPKYRGHDIAAFFDHAHNDYFEFGVETGIIGLFLVGSCFLLSLWVALLAQYKRRNPLNLGIAFSVVMALTAILIHSTVDFNLQIPANAATFMVIMAMGWIAYYLPHQGKRRHRSS